MQVKIFYLARTYGQDYMSQYEVAIITQEENKKFG